MILQSLTLNFFLLGAAAILLIGFFGRAVARKTSVPHIIWLMAFGIVAISLLGFVSQDTLVSIMPFVSSFVILIFLFTAGLGLNLKKLFREVSRASVLAIANFSLSAVFVFALMYVLGYTPLIASLTGLIVGSIDASVIPYVFRELSKSDLRRDIVSLESAISGPLGIILVLVAIDTISINNYQISFLASTLISEFSIGIVLGGAFAFVWVPIMSFFQRFKYAYSYAASLGLVFVVYTLVQDLGGSGPISAFMFGLVIANGEDIYKNLKYRHSSSFTLSRESKSFNDLITFFTMSFFFVYVGGLISLTSYLPFLIGISLGLVTLIARTAGTRIALFRSRFSGQDKNLISYMLSRGTGTAVIALLPVTYGIVGIQFLDIVFATIVTTVLANAALTYWETSTRGGSKKATSASQ